MEGDPVSHLTQTNRVGPGQDVDIRSIIALVHPNRNVGFCDTPHQRRVRC